MDDVSLAHAKEHLEELIERARCGEDVRITDPRLGTVKLTALDAPQAPPRTKRVPGRWKGRLTAPEGVFDPLDDEELKHWYGE